MYLVLTTNSQTYTIINKIAFDYYVIIKLSAMCKALLAMQSYTRNYSSTGLGEKLLYMKIFVII